MKGPQALFDSGAAVVMPPNCSGFCMDRKAEWTKLLFVRICRECLALWIWVQDSMCVCIYIYYESQLAGSLLSARWQFCDVWARFPPGPALGGVWVRWKVVLAACLTGWLGGWVFCWLPKSFLCCLRRLLRRMTLAASWLAGWLAAKPWLS